MIITTHQDQETFVLGQKIATKCVGGEFIALVGELGSGKTKLIQGLAKGLGIKKRVNSPTFNVLKLYNTDNKQGIRYLCHVDAYRLHSGKELINLGIQEFINDSQTITVVEWAEIVKKIWPLKTNLIKIKFISESERKIKLNGSLFSNF